MNRAFFLIMRQEFDKYKQEDFEVWKRLFERQSENLTTKACDAYLVALQRMQPVLNADNVPNFNAINDWFKGSTGWQIECVPGLIPVEDFFQLLARKHFCSSTWLRSMQQLDYLEEPDMFHDIFGHVPLLSDPVFSDFAQEFGKLGRSVINQPEKVLMLQRIYWFTIEFGLIEQNGSKIYGAGIASSFGESNLSVSGSVPTEDFDVERVMNTSFHTDQLQTHYVKIQSSEELFEAIVRLTHKWKQHEMARK